MHRTFRLDPDSALLLMIDFQEQHRSDPTVMAHQYGDVLLRAAMVLAAARRSGVAVVHSGYCRDVGQGDGLSRFPLAQFSPETAAEPGEPSLIRQQSSVFSSPELAGILDKRACETLMIAGVWTEATVAATVRDAVAAGLRVLIVKDACGSGSELMHRTATLNLGNRLYGGGILDTMRAADLLTGHDARLWMLEEVIPFKYIPETVAPLYNAL